MRRDTYVYHRPEKRRIGVEELCGKVAILQERLRAVKILKNQTQQLGALNDSRLDSAPLVCGNQEWNNVDLPRSICPKRVAVDVVGDSVLTDAALRSPTASSQLLRPDGPK